MDVTKNTTSETALTPDSDLANEKNLVLPSSTTNTLETLGSSLEYQIAIENNGDNARVRLLHSGHDSSPTRNCWESAEGDDVPPRVRVNGSPNANDPEKTDVSQYSDSFRTDKETANGTRHRSRNKPFAVVVELNGENAVDL